jgi:hypothetical protein
LPFFAEVFNLCDLVVYTFVLTSVQVQAIKKQLHRDESLIDILSDQLNKNFKLPFGISMGASAVYYLSSIRHDIIITRFEEY